MARRIRACVFILWSIVLLVVVYYVFFLKKRPKVTKVFRLTPLRQELIRELAKGNSSLDLNADEHRQDGVNTIILTGMAGETVDTLRKSSEPVKFQAFKNNGDQLKFYDHLLTSKPWHSNPRNLAEFRKKLMNHTNSTFQDEFVLTHHNTKVGDILPFSFDNSMPHAKKLISYNMSEKVFAEDVFTNSPLSGKRFKRCSVVGNSGILSDSKCGKEIDQSDYVIRSNLPIIHPHAADAGWKTNLTTMNPSLVIKRFNSLKTKKDTDEFIKAFGEYDGVLWLPCVAATIMTDICFKAKHTLKNYGIRNPKTIIANPLHFLAVADFWKKRTVTQVLSTGFYLTQLALTMCEETHLYGFWPFSYRMPDRVTDTGTNTMREVKYHYFDEVKLSKAHSMTNEFSVLLQMHLLGLLKLHVRDCGV